MTVPLPYTQPRAVAVLRGTPAKDHVTLDYEGRFLRRKRLISAAGLSFLVDLAETSYEIGRASCRERV